MKHLHRGSLSPLRAPPSPTVLGATEQGWLCSSIPTTYRRIANCTDIVSQRRKFAWCLKGLKRAQEDGAGGASLTALRQGPRESFSLTAPWLLWQGRGNSCRELVCFLTKTKKSIKCPYLPKESLSRKDSDGGGWRCALFLLHCKHQNKEDARRKVQQNQ